MQTAECIFTSIVVKLLIQGGHFTILGIVDISLKFRVGNREKNAGNLYCFSIAAQQISTNVAA